MKKKWLGVFPEDPYHLPLCVHLSCHQLSLTQPVCTFWVIKGKEKKQIIFLYISIVVFLCNTTVAGGISLYVKKVKLATIVEGDPKAPFSIATTPRCRGRALLLSLDCSTLPLMHTLYCWMLSKEVSSTIFKVFGMMRPGTEPRSPGPLTNTLPTSQWAGCVLTKKVPSPLKVASH